MRDDRATIEILLLEPVDSHRGLLTEAIKQAHDSVSVTAVACADQFRRALVLTQYDCIVVEQCIKQCDIAELLAETRDARAGCPTLVVVSTGDQQTVIACMRAGCDDFVSKRDAIVEGELWQRIEVALESSNRQRHERRQRVRRERDLVSMAHTDALTGLSNRRAFDDHLQSGQWSDDRRLHLGCVLIDVDHFKQVNDTYGHDVGDAVLREVAAHLKSAVSAIGTAFRWGGEEFLVVLSGVDLTSTWAWAKACRKSLAALTIQARGASLSCTASFGVTYCLARHFSHDIVQEADDALYLAKAHGRNRTCTADMVRIHGVIDAVAGASPDPLDRHRMLIQRIGGGLTPTQFHVVTSHSQATAHLASRVARRLRFDTDRVEHVRRAALTQNLAMCVMPDSLLANAHPLSPEERLIAAMRPSLSRQLAAQLGFGERVLDLISRAHLQPDTSVTGSTRDSDGAGIVAAADLIVAAQRNGLLIDVDPTSAVLNLIADRHAYRDILDAGHDDTGLRRAA